MGPFLFVLLLLLAVGRAADCTNNQCKNGGTCTTPRLYTKLCPGEYMIYALSGGRMYTYAQQYGVVAGTGKNPNLGGTVYAVNITTDVTIMDCKGGLHHTLALDNNKHVWAWGSSLDGRPFGLQGMGPNFFQEGTPTRILADVNGVPFENIVAIAPGPSYNMALNSSGTVFVWGDVPGGLVGDGNTSLSDRFAYYPTPVKIPVVPGSKIIKIASGTIGMALGDDGTVYSWGGAVDGQCSLGWLKTTACSDVPSTNNGTVGKVNLPLSPKVIDIFCGGSSFFYALTEDGTLFGWGLRAQYAGFGTGNSTWNPIGTPVNLTSIHKFPYPVRQVATGQSHTIVILADGSLWGWGSTVNAEVGNGVTSSTSYVPTAVKISTDTDWYDVYSSPNQAYYTYAQKNDGTLYSWGRNKLGILGNGVLPTVTEATYNGDFNVPYPTQVDPLNLKYSFSQTAFYCLQNASLPACAKETIPADFCHPSNCQAGTSCQLLEGGYRFVCDCSTVPQLAGITCNITKSAKVPSSGYSCACPSGFGGVYCEWPRPADVPSSGSTTSPTSSSPTSSSPTPAPTSSSPTSAPTPSSPTTGTQGPTQAPTQGAGTQAPTQSADTTGVHDLTSAGAGQAKLGILAFCVIFIVIALLP